MAITNNQVRDRTDSNLSKRILAGNAKRVRRPVVPAGRRNLDSRARPHESHGRDTASFDRGPDRYRNGERNTPSHPMPPYTPLCSADVMVPAGHLGGRRHGV